MMPSPKRNIIKPSKPILKLLPSKEMIIVSIPTELSATIISKIISNASMTATCASKSTPNSPKHIDAKAWPN